MPHTMVSASSMAGWLSVLDRVQASVELALHDLDAQERLLDDAAVHADLATAEQQTLATIDIRMETLARRLEVAAHAVVQIDQLVTHDESEVVAWRRSAQAVRERLTTLAGGGVS